MKQQIKNWLIHWITFFLTVCILSVWYATISNVWTNTSTLEVNTWSTLSATSWNQLLWNFEFLKSKTENISSNWWNIGIWVENPWQKLSVAWTIESITWWYKFPDGTIQTTKAVSWKVLQVWYSSKSNSWSALTSWNNFYTVPWLSVTLTPSSVNSKMLLTLSLYGWVSSYQIKYRILRNWVPVILWDGEGWRPVATWVVIPYDTWWPWEYQLAFLWWTYMDLPATTQPVTYEIQMAAYNWQTVYLNRSHMWQNSLAWWYDASPVSSMTIMEIAN